METSINYPKYRWYVMLMAIVATIAQGMMLIAPTPLIGEVAKTLNSDLGIATAALMMPFTLMVAIGGVLSGFLLDKIGIAKTFMIGTALAAIAGILTVAAGDKLGLIIVLRLLQGLGCGPIIASGPKVAAEWFPPLQRGLYQGVVGAALSLGITIGLMTGPQIAAGSSWQAAISTFGIVMAIGFILVVIYNFGPKPPINNALNMEVDKGQIKKIFGLPSFWVVLIVCFALSWVMQGYNDLTPGHIAVPEPAGLNMGPAVAGQLMGMYTFAFMVGSLISGFVAEKIFRGKYKTAVTVTFVLTAIFCYSVLLPAVNSNTGTLTVCLIIAGLFMGMPMPIAQTFVANSFPEHLTGAVGGVTMGIGIFGGTVGVAAGSAALHATHMYNVSIYIVVVVAIVGAIVAFGLNRPSIFTQETNVEAVDEEEAPAL